MQYEVENKFRVSSLDEVRRRVVALGAQFRQHESQIDTYYNHPARDFRETDEALRVRNTNGAIRLTYKGPRTEAALKIREEIELPLAPSLKSETDIHSLLQRLGFRFVARVVKSRDVFEWPRDAWHVVVSLDDVEQIGTFVEVELIAAAEGLESAKAIVADACRKLGLNEPTRASYLKMVLAANGARSSPSG